MTDEQQMLRDSAERYLRDNYAFAERQILADRGEPIDQSHWQAFVEMGWATMPFSEADGGFGFGLAATVPLAELFGYYLVREPLLESVLVAGSVIASGPEAARQRFLPGIMDGSIIATVPHPPDPLPTLLKQGDQLIIQGRLEYVPSGGSATHLVTPANHGDALNWVIVDLAREGALRDVFMTHDGRLGGHITLDVTLDPQSLLLSGVPAETAHKTAYHRAMLLATAEGVGAMQAALDLTVEYTRQRYQFGQPLSSFQALQHRMADMLIQIELSRSLLGAACLATDQGTDDAAELTLAAKAKVDAAARGVTQEAIQMHGGIATTNEYRVGHYFKRMALLASWPQHRDALVEEFIRIRRETN